MQLTLAFDTESKESFKFILFLKIVHPTGNSIWKKPTSQKQASKQNLPKTKKEKEKKKHFQIKHTYNLCATSKEKGKVIWSLFHFVV